uniref:ATP synthase F0 subunit 8 n=1 Tax=Neocentrocnemis stali TaxID=888042 RepID=A0A7I6HH27_9HEMI|nr:ATP synthase F0 subunit 8 [Neocentrocnemis stali]AGO28029.1 ATP synthase F0 subunit 8 [Neocentrocnemis stali]
MPQMAPIWWLTMMTMIMLTFLTSMTFMYFLMMKKSGSMMTPLYKGKEMNLMW